MFVATGAIGGRNTRVIWRQHAIDGSNQSTYTFTGVNFGAVSTRRHIIVAFGFGAGSLGASLAPPTMTIGGVSATAVIDLGATSGTSGRPLWIAAVPTGTTGTIVVTRASGMTYGIIEVWTAYDLISATPVHTVAGTLANPSTGNLTTSSGGIAVGMASAAAAGGGFTWTNLTENDDATGSGTASAVQYTAADASKTASGTLALSLAQGGAIRMFAASFR